VPRDVCDLLCLDLPLAEELRSRRLDQRVARRLAGRFRALSDPTRLSVAVALREADELCVCDLAWILERAQNLVSHHLRALRAEGLVDFRREGKMALYSLTERGRALLELVGAEEPTTSARGGSTEG
jgi:ArsR family transcriptional regulator, lead/cadmium/zinc/bismuth-responsive transcriptional repressor